MKSKAIFLLVTFLLNTIVGFGCALGMEGVDHQHGHQTNPISELNFSKEDACCKILVSDLVTLSKLIPESSKVQVVLSIVWLPDYISLVPATIVELDQRFYVEQRERPPNKDIRIVIQSFQI